jgi:hypothetical protein
VKQLLKETENYLRKLGSKLKDAKAMAKRFGGIEHEDNRAGSSQEKNVLGNELEEESDNPQVFTVPWISLFFSYFSGPL